VHRRAVLRGAVVVPHGEVVAHRVRLAVANYHAENFSARHPRAHPRLHARLRDRDLVARAVVVVHVRVVRQPALVRAPAHLGGRHAFFVEALDRPGVHELVDALGLARDLGVALADVDDLGARQHGEGVEAPFGERTLDELRAVAGLLVFQQRSRDFGERALGEVADEARVGAVLEHRRRAVIVGPRFDHAPQALVPHIQRALERMRVVHVVIRVPQFDARVQIAHAVLAAPGENRRAVDVPREVEDEVARTHARREELVEILFGHAALLVSHAGLDGVGDALAVVDEVDDGDA